MLAQQVKMDMAKRGRALVDVAEKRKWLNDWALEKGGLSTIKEAKQALQDRFGEGLGTSYIARTLKDARQLMLDERRRLQGPPASVTALAEAHPLVPVPPVIPTTDQSTVVKSIANLMRISGIRRISIDDDGKVSFEAFF